MDLHYGNVPKHRDGADWLVWDVLSDGNPFPPMLLGWPPKRLTSAVCACGWSAGPHRGLLGQWLIDLRFWWHRRT